MRFLVYKQFPNVDGLRNMVLLVRNNWDDWFRYETKFILYYINNQSETVCLGSVKIGQEKIDNQLD